MKRLFFILALASTPVFFVPDQAHADKFQFRQRSNGDTYYTSYATVRVRRGNAILFNGRTDKYGRITISLPSGQYDVEVGSSRGLATLHLTLDGQIQLKTVDLK